MRVDAVQREREPDRQATRPAGELVAEVARVVGVVVGAQHVDVRTVLGVDRASELRLPVHQRARTRWREEPLVRVDDERVGPSDAGELDASSGSSMAARPYAPSTWNHASHLLGDVGASVEIVDDPCVGRSAGRDDDADVAPVADRRAQRRQPVSRQSGPVGTTSGSSPSRCSALSTEACAVSATATTRRSPA